MTQRKRIVIIGGGAAGLMAAVGAGGWASAHIHDLESRPEIIVLEKMPRPGRKIMITGKGRCNFTNLKKWEDFSSHVHPKANILKSAFFNLTPEGMIDFLQRCGLECVVERGDRAFPASHLASDVVDTLYNAAVSAGAKIMAGAEVSGITAAKDEQFNISLTGGRSIAADRVIVATGGLSYPKTGSTGDGLEWAQLLGIKVNPCLPSLTALVPRGYKDIPEGWTPSMKGHIDRELPLSEYGRQLFGIELDNISMSLVIDGNETAAQFGDICFTDGGLEGPVGFMLSRKAVTAISNGSKVAAKLDLKPAVEQDELHARVLKLWDEVCKDKRSEGRLYAERFKILLTKLMPSALVPAFLAGRRSLDHKGLTAALKSWVLPLDGFVGYERCVVTAGGVDAGEIIPKSLESRKVKGLYLAGEVLDLDADTGGYNLHIAFCTGYLAGQSAVRSL